MKLYYVFDIIHFIYILNIKWTTFYIKKSEILYMEDKTMWNEKQASKEVKKTNFEYFN